ncbi:L,D-transpeptidase family protein [Pedobacter sp.]|uniref:L,D-transpeptidase family protein n=1 Tax=Pedobacter sp. TaxID=1411316 RepID=UPI003D7FAB1D
MESSTNKCGYPRLKKYIGLVIGVLFMHLSTQADASLSLRIGIPKFSVDTSVKAAIIQLLTLPAEMAKLNYPKSVGRFYSKANYEPSWINTTSGIEDTREAIAMLSCVVKYGLSPADYHPKDLNSSTMNVILASPSTVTPEQKARFDMLMTDALISFINNLHYGKLNPVYTRTIIDNNEVPGFSANSILTLALNQQEFVGIVLSAQPQAKEYVLLQNYMKDLKGQYIDDCLEAPEAMVRKLAINMERLRWAAINQDVYVHVNIPSYNLKLNTPATSYQFNVIVGKPTSPTPELQSLITYFETAPDWKVPSSIFIKEMLPKAIKNPAYLDNNHLSIYDSKGNYVQGTKANLAIVKKNPSRYYMRQSAGCDNSLGLVIFRFKNPFSIFLHDTPNQQMFDRKVRALSHGCIRVQQAEKLGTIFLELDGQNNKIASFHQGITQVAAKTFKLKKPIPIKITYLTCEIGVNGIVEYNDVYNRDRALELALFGTN